MPLVETLAYRLEDLTKGAITRGAVEIEEDSELTFGAAGVWEEVEGVRLENVEIPSEARAILLQSSLDLVQTLGDPDREVDTFIFYCRININNGSWVSPVITITIENESVELGEEQFTRETGNNIYLMGDNETDNFRGNDIDVSLEIQADGFTEEGRRIEIDGVLSTAILLR